ncbi:MAG: hypothetical protein C1943_12880 [Halochromatium sp.]|nr:hypothetical protein [Halochromatium sp.]
MVLGGASWSTLAVHDLDSDNPIQASTGFLAADLGWTLSGVVYHRFSGRSSNALDADELTLYVDWTIDDHLSLHPLISLYDPRFSAEQGSTQLGNDGINLYVQLRLSWSY